MAEENQAGSQAPNVGSGNQTPSPATPGNATEPVDVIETVRSLVRPFLAVAFTGATIVLTLKGALPAAVVATAATAISAFYFGERSALKPPGGPARPNPQGADRQRPS